MRWILALMVVISSPALAADDDARAHFSESGFSIATLSAPPAGTPSQPLTMSLPPVDGFSPNVNVQVQPYGDSIEAYLKLTVAQIEASPFSLVGGPSVDGATATFEYQGTMSGRDLRWYATATKHGGHVYLVTATSPAARWDELGDEMRRVVDSFRLDGD